MALEKIFWQLTLTLSVLILFTPNASLAQKGTMNVIDKCWRSNPQWRRYRHQLATCSVGFVGKMTYNIGKGVVQYEVTDSSDDHLKPKPGTLRYGATLIPGKVWITFKRDMNIKFSKPLLISSFTTIDGRGVNVHISGGACLIVYKVFASYH
ncbi:probable pectate lyase 5 [Tripterygium wilfordii]|uniref:probable pectate lyase 5 n=1 Tax=Tripterygium wilfordii TaxID=458696 RepID=UPI0018F806B3|nr:probable pectate lyase 5 [Tripterygium wilfordii]